MTRDLDETRTITAEQSRERHRITENLLLSLVISEEIARRDAEGIERHESGDFGRV